MFISDPQGKSPQKLGLGMTPMWNATGDRLAFLKPEDPGACGPATICSGDKSVVVVDPGTGDSVPVAPPGDWSLMGWLGGRVLLKDPARPDRTISFSLSGGRNELQVDPRSILASSPDGRHLIVASDGGADILSLEGAKLSGDPVHIDGQGRPVSAAAWSHDSKRVALVSGPPSGGKKAGGRSSDGGLSRPLDSAVSVVDADGQHLTMVEETSHVTRAPIWSATNDHLLLVRLLSKGGFEQAFYCPVQTNGSCRLVLTISTKMDLLRME